MNLRHFFALNDIAHYGRLSEAADRVYMSQSGLTQALRKLEDAVGAHLFERVGFGVTETDAGKKFVRRSRRAIQLMAETERELASKNPGSLSGLPLHRHVTASQLIALVAVVETGGYSTAARRLKIAQPTVYRATQELGATIGIKLFIRAPRGVEPTESAKILARCAELLFSEIRQGFEEVAEMRGGTDCRIAVGSLPLARSGFLPTALTQLLSSYPDARVSILDGPYIEQLHALRYGRIDWLIGALRDPSPTVDVIQEPLFDQPLSVVVRPNHPLLQLPNPSVEHLIKLEWVAPRALTPAREFFDGFFKRHDSPVPTRVIECSSLIVTRGLLLQSERAALLSPLQVREDVATGKLAVLIDNIPGSERTIGMTVRDNWEPTKAQKIFTKILRQLADKVVPT